MRNIALIILTFIQLIVLIISILYRINIDYLSLRIILVALVSVLSLYMILLYQSKCQLYIAIGSLMLALIHVIWLIMTVYHVVYS
ncbi:hypothetical protein BU649_01520 [Staphylococcus chromogenes]|uniref:Uncharacterized protein n=3 Tax=Staphylococcus chromogenes TaxID=46126 RepID=A0AAX0ZH84_STACR|nr:hypothetical protein [Staphylococcus chromogenes]KDP12727.1 hypothetical protein SCHR_06215 [Staphylococcus chromogenes MU 970]MBV5137429.1 hypothetical protein [Staphylococcus chromogenes]MBW6088308.1 hypothetical protein [Staphylococcus chromogenes]MCD9059795.1 hypothetical protein [Staphylococcus chromogenes]MCD9061943.1 hypothetical protein [Staphylococcus chromogenes]